MTTTPLYTDHEPRGMYLLESIPFSKITNTSYFSVVRYPDNCVCEQITVYDTLSSRKLTFRLIEKSNRCFDLLMLDDKMKPIYLFPMDGDLFDGRKLRYTIVKFARLGLTAYRNWRNIFPILNF